MLRAQVAMACQAMVCAMEFAGGEEVVGAEEEHTRIGNQRGDQHVAVDECEGPAFDGGDEQRRGGNQNEALAELIGMGHPKSCERARPPAEDVMFQTKSMPGEYPRTSL